MSIRSTLVTGLALFLAGGAFAQSVEVPYVQTSAAVQQEADGRDLFSLVSGPCPVMVSLYTDAQFASLKDKMKTFNAACNEAQKKLQELKKAHKKVVSDKASTPEQLKASTLACHKQEVVVEVLERDLQLWIAQALTPEQDATMKTKYPRVATLAALTGLGGMMGPAGLEGMVYDDTQYATATDCLTKAQESLRSLRAKSQAAYLAYAKAYEAPETTEADLESSYQAWQWVDLDITLVERNSKAQVDKLPTEAQKQSLTAMKKRISEYEMLLFGGGPDELRDTHIFLQAAPGQIMAALFTEEQFKAAEALIKPYQESKDKAIQAAQKAGDEYYKLLQENATEEKLKPAYLEMMKASFPIEKWDLKLEKDMKQLLPEKEKAALPGLVNRWNEFSKLLVAHMAGKRADQQFDNRFTRLLLAVVYTDAQWESAKSICLAETAPLKTLQGELVDKRRAYYALYTAPGSTQAELETAYLAWKDAEYAFSQASHKRDVALQGLLTPENKETMKKLSTRLAKYEKFFFQFPGGPQ